LKILEKPRVRATRSDIEFGRAIVEFLRAHPGATFSELTRGVAGFAGSAAVGTGFGNLILWRGVSEEAVRVLAWLEKRRRVRFEVTTVHPYGQDGRSLQLPPARELKDHDSPHWLPVLLHANKP
jgi:hypothetical protein